MASAKRPMPAGPRGGKLDFDDLTRKAHNPGRRKKQREFYQNAKLIRSYDFTFGFCIPNSTNSWEAIYPVPERTPEEIAEFQASPNGHRSDSFYFVGDKLIMHNKAMYNYN